MATRPKPPHTTGLFERKDLDAAVAESARSGYRRVLGAWSLLSLGIAAIVGAGIFTGIGNAARAAGPAVIVAFVIAGLACIFTALAYAELASMIPGSGSAYTYVFAALGRMPAFNTAWLFVLYIVVGNMFIATGWSAYFNAALDGLGIPLPRWLQVSFLESADGGMNLPAFTIMVLVTLLVVLGIRESVGVGNVLVVFKVLVVLFFVGVGVVLIRPANWEPFAPAGLSGVGAAVGAAFFAYVGFEAMTTTAEESRNPRRDLPIGIIGSLSIVMVLYILVAIVLTGMVPAAELDAAAPLARAFQARGANYADGLVVVGALAATTTVLIAFQLALPRVFQAVARDGFLPRRLARIHPRFHTPVPVTVVGGVVTALGAALFPADLVLGVEVLSALGVYILACVAVLVLKRTHPGALRKFRVHAAFPVLGIVFCAYILAVQAALALLVFLGWIGLGLMLYGFYGHRTFLRHAAQTPGR